MAENVYDVGDQVRLTATFALNGVGTNTTAALRILLPDGTTTSPTPVSDGAGVYHYDLTLTQPGRHRYRWSGTGTVVTAEEGSFLVRTQTVT
jgi:hypothetical protein